MAMDNFYSGYDLTLTTQKWKDASRGIFLGAERDRRIAEVLAKQARQITEEMQQRANRRKIDVDKKLEQRVYDIKFWKAQLEKKMIEIDEEIAKLEGYVGRIERTLSACDEPLEIAQRCLKLRECRPDPELVNDRFQKEIVKEIELLTELPPLFQNLLDQLIEQIRFARSTKTRIEDNLEEKDVALDVDSFAAKLHLDSPELAVDTMGDKKPVLGIINVEDWKTTVDRLLEQVSIDLENGPKLRSLIDSVLQQACSDVMKQRELVDEALRNRIREIRELKAQLEKELPHITVQIEDLLEAQADLHRMISERQPLIRLAERRLMERSNRPTMEAIKDPAQKALLFELEQLKNFAITIENRDNKMRRMLVSLRKRQAEIERDIELKTEGLRIDEVEITALRNRLVPFKFYLPY